MLDSMHDKRPGDMVRRIANSATYAQGFAAIGMGAVLWSFERVAAISLLVVGVGNIGAKIGRRLDRGLRGRG